MNYLVRNGAYFLDPYFSNLEKKILDDCCKFLDSKNFKYLAIPSLVSKYVIDNQGIVNSKDAFPIDKYHCLGGSAEQGILEFLTHFEPSFKYIYSFNHCFRNEDNLNDLKYVKEFKKVEQYCITDEKSWQYDFKYLLSNAEEFVKNLGLEYRIVDKKDDEGYHLVKYDIEIRTKKFGWLETHSCSYFGNNQLKRFNLKNHSISCTGIASPRILIPFIENYEN
ncbi:MAG: hypothetical protein LC122_12165 [Chitinophagales bacterium]|nr:hypothetical protein [Chitinophagales bacterium]